MPQVYEKLQAMGVVQKTDILAAQDGFCAVFKSISSILAEKELYTFPGEDGRILRCENYFDDWYLYAVPGQNGHVYGLFKLREQEFDKQQGLDADGDAPGVTISFIAFDAESLLRCLRQPSSENAKSLAVEINRVVAYSGQRHHPLLKAYFIRPEAEGAYLAAELYVRHIASFVRQGCVAVPEHYRQLHQKSCAAFAKKRDKRLPNFVDHVNAAAGRMVCDHDKIYVRDAANLDMFEKTVILATHTGNTSFHSFAAEVRFHARFLVWFAKIPIPFMGSSPYASAIRADMSVQDSEMQGPKPYYRKGGRLIKAQIDHHPQYHAEC